MRSFRRLLWPVIVLALAGMAACATDTELNPQPLPPGSSSGGEKNDDGESTQGPNAGSGAVSDAGTKPPPQPDASDAGDAGPDDGGDGG